MGGKSWFPIVVVLAVLGGLGWVTFRAPIFPNVTMTSEAGPVTVDQARGARRKLVLALVMPTDPNSKAAVQKMKAEHEISEAKATFAALMLADPASAAAYEKAEELPFTVYALRPQDHPVEYNQVVKTIGGFRERFIVGTVLVLDEARHITQQVNGNELEKLPSTLQRL